MTKSLSLFFKNFRVAVQRYRPIQLDSFFVFLALQITIEGIVRLTRNNTLSEGDTVFVTGTAKVNGGQIYVQQFGLVVKDVYDGPIDNVVRPQTPAIRGKYWPFNIERHLPGVTDMTANMVAKAKATDKSLRMAQTKLPPRWLAKILKKFQSKNSVRMSQAMNNEAEGADARLF